MLRTIDIGLPQDPGSLREWSLVMVMTGVLTAIDRDVLPGRHVVIHASGSYGIQDYVELQRNHRPAAFFSQ